MPSTALAGLRPAQLAVLAYAGTLVLLLAYALATGSTPSIAVCIGVALAPPALWLAARRPLVFPFCAYVLVMPFDTLGRLGGFGTLTKLVGLFCAAALLIRLLQTRDAVAPPRALFGWLALLGWMTLSALWAIEAGDSLPLAGQYASLLGLYALLALTPVRKADLDAVLVTTVAASVIASAYTASMFAAGHDVLSSGRVIIHNGDYYIDPNNFAAALVLPFGLAAHWLTSSRSWLARGAAAAAMLVLAAGLAASGSRGGALAVGALFLWLAIRSRKRVAVVAIGAVATAATLLANPGFVARFMEARTSDAAGRTDIWKVGILAFRDHWALGAGVGNFQNAFDHEYLNVYARYVLGWHWAAHNTFLQFGVELGVIGLALMAVALVLQATMLRGIGRDDALFDLRITLEGALIGLLVAALSGTILNEKYTWLLFSAMALVRGYAFTRDRANAQA